MLIAVMLFGVAVVIIVLLVIRARRMERARQAQLRQWADDNGWSYMPSPSVDWGTRLPGRNRRGVSLLLAGRLSGRRVGVAEYSYTQTSTSTNSDGTSTTSSQTHRFVVVVVKLPGPLPDLAVQPRAGLSRLARTWFGAGAKGAGDATFDRAYRVIGDPAVAARMIPDALIAEHVAGTVPPWSVHGDEIMTHQRGSLEGGERIPELVAPLLRVADHLAPQQPPP